MNKSSIFDSSRFGLYHSLSLSELITIFPFLVRVFRGKKALKFCFLRTIYISYFIPTAGNFFEHDNCDCANRTQHQRRHP